MPTLVVSAGDDLFTTGPGARYTAARIPDAALEMLPDGGHLMLGQGARVRQRVRDFLASSRTEPDDGTTAMPAPVVSAVPDLAATADLAAGRRMPRPPHAEAEQTRPRTIPNACGRRRGLIAVVGGASEP